MDITIVHAFHSHYENLQHANAVLFVFRRCDPHKDFLRISDSRWWKHPGRSDKLN